jgi:hypothetical protein
LLPCNMSDGSGLADIDLDRHQVLVGVDFHF